MNILKSIQILTEFSKAVEIGEEIKDPVGWKDKQVLLNKVGIIVMAALAIARISGFELPEGIGEYATEALVGIMLMVNVILTWATSKKVGKDANKNV